ncbi:MAG TPA: DUF881 domain-containing protein [Candidatus Acidoferrales bacterium]|nr:DUF881 domain-containing protein [Candidatus Acidoferrales bacterium]
MDLRRPGAYLLAIVALAFGFVVAVQWRSQLIAPGNRIEQNQALLQSVLGLERQNQQDRSQVASLRVQIGNLEADASTRSDQTNQLAATVNGLRAEAGATTLRGPGLTVTLDDGKKGPDLQGATAWVVTYQDVQDVVNLLFQGGAEGVAVNSRRITPLSSFQGTGGTVVIDQGPPLLAPFRISAVGDRDAMQSLLSQTSSLGDLRLRQRLYGVSLNVDLSTQITLPATDSSLEVRFAHSP